jgi:hypothetical protein
LRNKPGPLAHAAPDALVDQHLPVTVRAAELTEDLEDPLEPQNERCSLEVTATAARIDQFRFGPTR